MVVPLEVELVESELVESGPVDVEPVDVELVDVELGGSPLELAVASVPLDVPAPVALLVDAGVVVLLELACVVSPAVVSSCGEAGPHAAATVIKKQAPNSRGTLQARADRRHWRRAPPCSSEPESSLGSHPRDGRRARVDMLAPDARAPGRAARAFQTLSPGICKYRFGPSEIVCELSAVVPARELARRGAAISPRNHDADRSHHHES